MTNQIKEKLIDEIKKRADNVIRDLNNNISVSNPPLPNKVKGILINQIRQGAEQAIEKLTDNDDVIRITFRSVITIKCRS